jgi:transcriptional regulator with XRE-family HTH domain
MLIGAKLKSYRKSKGLSLRAVAEISEVTVGTLSQIENDKTSPSVGTLKRVLKALDLSMGQFFSVIEDDDSSSQIVFKAEDRVNVSPLEGLSLYALPKFAGERKIQMLFEVYEVGAGTGNDYYSHEGEECGVCLEGLIELHVDGKTYRLEPGDMYYFDSTKQHRFTNIGETQARVISACTPASF